MPIPLGLDALNARVSVRGRMRILSVLMIIPVIVAGWSLYGALSTGADTARAELRGNSELQGVWPLLTQGAEGQTANPSDVVALTLEGGQKKADFTTADATALDGTKGAELMSAAADIADTVADKAGLSHDGNPDSFYLADAIAVRAPGFVVAAQKLYAANRSGSSAGLPAARAAFDAALSDLTASLTKAGDFSTAKTLSPEASRAQDALNDAAADFRKTPTIEHFSATVDATTQVFGTARHDLDVVLKHRVRAINSHLIETLGSVTQWLLFALLAVQVIGGGLDRRLRALAMLMQRMVNGETVQAIPYLEDGHETGAIADALITFQDAITEAAQLQRMQTQKAITMVDSRRQSMLDLADEFERNLLTVVDDLGDATRALNDSVGALRGDAETTSMRTGAAAAEIDANTAGVQSVAGATEEMAASSQAIADQAAHADTTAAGASAQAEEAMAVVVEMNAAADSIGQAVELIGRITAQTNLLALNATIEAARAGEAGRGFSVVASEVKALAKQTAKATEEITSQVQGVQAATARAGAAMERISQSVVQLRDISRAISQSVSQQTQAVGEISRSTAEVAASASRISQTIGEVSVTADRTGERARASAGSLEALSDTVIALRTAADAFLGGVRAA